MAPVPDDENEDHGHVPADLLEIWEMLEFDAQCQGFAHLNELRDVLLMEGKIGDDGGAL